MHEALTNEQLYSGRFAGCATDDMFYSPPHRIPSYHVCCTLSRDEARAFCMWVDSRRNANMREFGVGLSNLIIERLGDLWEVRHRTKWPHTTGYVEDLWRRYKNNGEVK